MKLYPQTQHLPLFSQNSLDVTDFHEKSVILNQPRARCLEGNEDTRVSLDLFYANVNGYRLDSARRNDFVVARLAPQTEHLPSAVIFGCSFTSAPQSPHLGIESPHKALINNQQPSCQ